MKFIKWANSHTWIYTVAIVSFVIIPVGVQFIPYFYGEHSTHGDWLGFWGSYLGIIPSGLIAYYVAHYQIDQQVSKDREKQMDALLPYFNVDKLLHGRKTAFIGNVSFDLIVSTKESNLPILYVETKTYLKSQIKGHDLDKIKTSIGHMFPSKSMTITINTDGISIGPDFCEIVRIDLKAVLTDGRRVFFTWGNGNNGTHMIESENKKWMAYVEKNKLVEAQKRNREF